MENLKQRIACFLFPVESDHWLAVLRVGLGVQLLAYGLSLHSDLSDLFGEGGNALVGRELPEAIVSLDSPFIPRLGWFVSLGENLGVTESTVLTLFWFLLLLASVCLILGVSPRLAAIAAWFLHLSAVKSGQLLSYGADNFTTIGLFYLMMAPMPDQYSFDHWFRKLGVKGQWRLGFHRRLLQIHMCFIYFFGGLEKCLGSGWWNGSSLWRALSRPPFNVFPVELLISWKALFPIAGILVCLLETSYPLFIWGKRTRSIWFIGILIMHILIAAGMGLYLFASIMMILNTAAFGPGFVFARLPGEPSTERGKAPAIA